MLTTDFSRSFVNTFKVIFIGIENYCKVKKIKSDTFFLK